MLPRVPTAAVVGIDRAGAYESAVAGSSRDPAPAVVTDVLGLSASPVTGIASVGSPPSTTREISASSESASPASANSVAFPALVGRGRQQRPAHVAEAVRHPLDERRRAR